MKLDVLEYVERENYHVCEDEEGNRHRVDIMVDGAFPGKFPQDLIGRTIECERLSPYITIAHGVTREPQGESNK